MVFRLSIIIGFYSIQELNLFGFDVVIESGTSSHYILDVNYFPGKQAKSDELDRESDILKGKLVSNLMIDRPFRIS
jgi:hypothetical protein